MPGPFASFLVEKQAVYTNWTMSTIFQSFRTNFFGPMNSYVAGEYNAEIPSSMEL